MITSIEHYYVHSSKIFHTFHRMFYNMPQIIFEYSLDFLRTFPGIFDDIPLNFFTTLPGMFGDIPRNATECSTAFSGMFENNP